MPNGLPIARNDPDAHLLISLLQVLPATTPMKAHPWWVRYAEAIGHDARHLSETRSYVLQAARVDADGGPIVKLAANLLIYFDVTGNDEALRIIGERHPAVSTGQGSLAFGQMYARLISETALKVWARYRPENG